MKEFISITKWQSAIFMFFAATCFNACTKDPYTTSSGTTPIPIFYGTDFIGHYESDRVESNGQDVSNLVRVTIDLQSDDNSQFLYKETNPSTGTVFSETLDVSGSFNMNETMDTLFLKVLIGSYMTQISTYQGEGNYTYENVVVNEYETVPMAFKRASPGKYILQRSFNGADQKYFLTKW